MYNPVGGLSLISRVSTRPGDEANVSYANVDSFQTKNGHSNE